MGWQELFDLNTSPHSHIHLVDLLDEEDFDKSQKSNDRLYARRVIRYLSIYAEELLQAREEDLIPAIN